MFSPAVAIKVDTPPSEKSRPPATSVVSKYIQLAADFSPQVVGDHLLFLEPLITSIVVLVEIALIFVIMFVECCYEYALWLRTVLRPYKVSYLLPCAAGLVMCFFGGNFMTTIAAVEAYRSVGYEQTLHCLKTLMADFALVAEASAADDRLVTRTEQLEEEEEENDGDDKTLIDMNERWV